MEKEGKKWKCNCGSDMEGDTRCGYCKMTLRDYEISSPLPQKEPAKDGNGGWEEEFDNLSTLTKRIGTAALGPVEEVYVRVDKQFIRNKIKLAEERLVARILEKKASMFVNGIRTNVEHVLVENIISIAKGEDGK